MLKTYSMKIYKNGDFAAINTDVGVFLFEASTENRSPFSGVTPITGNPAIPVRVGEYLIMSLGDSNALPEEMRKVLDENHITPELLNKQAQLLWGQGPELYRTRIENGRRVKEWLTAKEIRSWLNDWNWEDYLLKTVIEFRTMNGYFSKAYRNRGARIGKKAYLTHLEHVSCTGARLEWAGLNVPPKRIITGDFSNYVALPLKPYPVYDVTDPLANPIAMSYDNLYSFALNFNYSVPSMFALLRWIKLGSALPELLYNFNENSAAIRYHITAPAIYWQQKEDQLKTNCDLKGVDYTPEMLENLKDEVYKTFAEGLVGRQKAGKMLTSETIYDEIANDYVGWKVEVIDQKVKNYIDSQINLAKRADFAITAGFGLHPALSNMSADGNLPSGSEQLYAFKLYLKTAVDIPERITTQMINKAIRANFPGTDVRVGFYHDSVLTEEETSPGDRIRNN